MQGIELIIGAVLPPFVDIINQRIKNGSVRYIVALLISLVVGAVLHLSELSINNVLGSGAIIFGAAQSTYKLYWSGSGVRKAMLK